LELAKLKIRIRFDYTGRGRVGKSLFGGKSNEELSEEVRQHKVALIRNVPVQGIHIDEIDMSQEVYTVFDEITGKAVSYAPVFICFTADSLEDALKFTMKEEFRTIEVLEPKEITLSSIELERIFLRASEELVNYRDYLEKKINTWK
jgi:hypothetical protein